MKVVRRATHGDKLASLLHNRSLPPRDRDRVEAAVARYNGWVAKLAAANVEGGPLLSQLVSLLNEYKIYIDLELIFDSEENFLYRQNGQLKLSNTILEEFLPYLFDSRLVPGLARIPDAICGSHSSYAGLTFGSPFAQLSDGGVFVKKKDQDFAVSKIHHVVITDRPDSGDIYSAQFHVSHFATEIKTNLDKTMFQEASQTANELKAAVPGSVYVLLCEFLDMPPITSKLTSIDEVIVLRKAKRQPSNVRADYGTAAGRRGARQRYANFLAAHPFHDDSFERLLHHLNACFPEGEDLSEAAILARGYF